MHAYYDFALHINFTYINRLGYAMLLPDPNDKWDMKLFQKNNILSGSTWTLFPTLYK